MPNILQHSFTAQFIQQYSQHDTQTVAGNDRGNDKGKMQDLPTDPVMKEMYSNKCNKDKGIQLIDPAAGNSNGNIQSGKRK